MNKNTILGIIAIVAIIVGVYFYSKDNSSDVKTDEMKAQIEMNSEMSMESEMDHSTTTPSIKEFTVTGTNFKFVPESLTVKKGDTVRLTFKNTDGFHDLKIDEFKVATKQFKSPGEETVEFIADKTGTFEYYCSVGKHKDMGMKGTLTVTE